MKPIVLTAIAVLACVGAVGMPAQAATVPCEDMLQDLRTAVAGATLDPAAKQQVDDLQAKGIERCNADDDKRADGFFAQAMQIVGK